MLGFHPIAAAPLAALVAEMVALSSINFTPAGGGGAIPPVHDNNKRFRIRRDKHEPHVIRVGDWPTEAQMDEMAAMLARAERQDLAQFISSIKPPEEAENYDEDEHVLMLILSVV